MTLLRQSHIHLALTVSETGEKAPPKKWKVTNQSYAETATVISDIRRSLSGKLMKHRLRYQGNVKVFNDVKFTLFLANSESNSIDAQIADLRAMVGQEVKYVPIQHCADGLDHTTYIKSMYLSQMSDPRPFDPLLLYYEVDIELLEDAL